MKRRNEMSEGTGIVALGVIGAALIGGVMFIMPQYGVYASRLHGEAELAQSEFSKQVAVQTAKAKLEASKLEAETDVVRAEGIAKANKIVSESLGGPEGYLRWKYIEMLNETAGRGTSTIYIPTEAGLPILEANRHKGN
jgi:regulator of protease activity HflC (stomatin/prohibitin superfamily)